MVSNQAKIFFWGFMISFLGTLPLGVLNITAFQIAASKGIMQALYFIVAVILVELIVVRLTLIKNPLFNFSNRVLFYMLLFSVLFLLYLSLCSFVNANSAGHNSSDILFPMIRSTFVLGLVLSSINPLHVPFWLGWNSVISSRYAFNRTFNGFAFYIAATGLGTLIGFLLYVVAGKSLISVYQQHNFLLSCIMGVIYLVFAVILSAKFFKRKIQLNYQIK